MKLLFDQNLSPRLVEALSDLYPASSHVSMLGLDRASDKEIFVRARDEGYAIVTKDADFSDLNQSEGSPPRVIRLRLGNCTTSEIEATLRSRFQAVEALEEDAEANILELW